MKDIQRSKSAPKTKRNVSKKTRFEIFKRDSFTCQYCGAQPPTVTLVVDHITPKVADGPCEPINLITACESCNQGKGGRLLGEVHPRPDADLMYLATMQEVAEIERFSKAQELLQQKQKQLIVVIQKTWIDIALTNWSPDDVEILKMLKMGSLETCMEAVTMAAIAYRERRCDRMTWLRYMWGIFHNMNSEDEG